MRKRVIASWIIEQRLWERLDAWPSVRVRSELPSTATVTGVSLLSCSCQKGSSSQVLRDKGRTLGGEHWGVLQTSEPTSVSPLVHRGGLEGC